MLKKIREVFSVTHCNCMKDECRSCEADKLRVKEIEDLVQKDTDNIWFKQEQTNLEYVGDMRDYDERTELITTTKFFKILKESDE
jgi:hypothetical protein